MGETRDLNQAALNQAALNQTTARAEGGAMRHPWYDDRLGRTVRTGLGDVRGAQPSDQIWQRIAADLGLPSDAGVAVGLAVTPNGWLRRFERWRAELARPLGRWASISAIAVAVAVVAVSFDVVLSGQYGGPFAWSTAGLHQIGVPQDEAGIQPSPQNRAPADMSAARWWPNGAPAAKGERRTAGSSPLVLAPAYASRPPARVVVPR